MVDTHASEVLPETTPEAGIDVGLTRFAVLSDGREIASPEFFRHAERELRKAQHNLAHKTKGSNNARGPS